jgi:phasin protein
MQHTAEGGIEKRSYMVEEYKKVGEEFQMLGKKGFDAAVRSFSQVNKGFQAITAEVTDYSKKAFEDGTRALQQLIGLNLPTIAAL